MSEEYLLLDKIRKRDVKAFEFLFKKYYEELVLFANKYLYDQGASEDLVQEIFVFFWENPSKFNSNVSIKRYLYTTTRNRCINHLKKINIVDPFRALDINAVLDLNLNNDEDVEIDEKLYNKVIAVIKSMPTAMKAVFELRFISNYKYEEISEELDISINTVKTHLKRAKKKINNS